MTHADLIARRKNAVPQGVATATTIFASRAENAEIWDEEGRRYVDFAGGIAVLNVGHRHPRVIAAVEAQLKAYTHTAFQVVAYEPYIRLAERLNALAPIEGRAKTIFFTTGAEATENAVKVARAARGRPGVIAFAGGFHGRTLLSSAMTGKVSPYKRGLGPFPGEIYHLPLPSATTGSTIEHTRRALDVLFAADLEPERIAALIVEPIQGEGGFHEPDPELFTLIESLQKRFGILFVADEVQSGFARTGKMFGIEHWSIKPDLITVAKSLAGGFPLSALIGRADIMDAIAPGGLGGTYGGSPIGCAAANAVLDVIEDENLVERAKVIGDRIRRRLFQLAERNDLVRIANIRGPGAMIAFDIVGPSHEAPADAAKRLSARALQEGLILLTCGQHGQAIRILVPLTVSDATLDEGLDRLERALIRRNGDWSE